MATDELVDIVLDVDLTKDPECESQWHTVHTHFHHGPATHMFRSPCHHFDGLRCLGWVNGVKLGTPMRCTACDALYHASDLILIEL